jgi:hypothetical protein
MGINNSILLISVIVICALHGYFFFKPIKLVTLPGKTYCAYFATSCVLLMLITEGVVLFAALCLEFLTAWITFNRIPVLRSVEQHTNTTVDGKTLRIDRVVHRYFWPHYKTLSKNSFRRGKLILVLPWVDVVQGFIYHYNGTTYNKLSHFAAAYPRHAGTVEQALAKSLG